MKIATISTTDSAADIATNVENDVQSIQTVSKLATDSVIPTTTKDTERLLTRDEQTGCNRATD